MAGEEEQLSSRKGVDVEYFYIIVFGPEEIIINNGGNGYNQNSKYGVIQ